MTASTSWKQTNSLPRKHVVRVAILSLAFTLGADCVWAREWMDITGEFSLEAEFISLRGTSVQLQKKDGKVITVPLERLSLADRKHVATISRTAAPPKPVPMDKEAKVHNLTPEEAIAAITKLKGYVDSQPSETFISLGGPVVRGPEYTDGVLAYVAAIPQTTHLWLRPGRVQGITDAGLKHLKGMSKLQSLQLAGTSVTDEGLLHLKELVDLKRLDLSYTKVTGIGLGHLRELPKLAIIDLQHAQVGADGLSQVHKLPKLGILRLAGNDISDAGLKRLIGSSTLESLDLSNTLVTDAGGGAFGWSGANTATS